MADSHSTLKAFFEMESPRSFKDGAIGGFVGEGGRKGNNVVFPPATPVWFRG
jgi:hypothetical protein